MSRLRLRSLLLALAAGLLAVVPGAWAYVLENVRWPNGTQVGLNLLLAEPGRTLTDGNTSWNQVAVDAMNIWNPYLGSGVQFQPNYDYLTPADGDGINSVFFDNKIYGESFDSDTIAVTLISHAGATLTETDVIVNKAKTFDSYRGTLRPVIPGGRVYDLRRVLIHEFGHVLGLDHSTSIDAIMYAYISDVDTVHSDDIAGVAAIYGEPIRQPVITSPATAFAKANEPFAYTVTATGGRLTYAAAGLPPGLQLSSAGAITGTAGTPGVYTVYVTVSNSVGSATATLTLTVGTPPTITSPSFVSAIVGLPFFYQITATGNPTGYGGTTAAGLGLTYNQATGTISGTPQFATSYFGTVSASNAGGTGSAHLSILVGYDLAATVLSTLSGSAFGGHSGVLTPGADGNFYTVANGGILQVTPGGASTLAGTLPMQGAPLYQTVNPDLVRGRDGNFYGTTFNGNTGSFFRVAPGGVAAALHQFTADEGGAPLTTPIQGRDGNFYGTLQPNASNPGGTFYLITPDGAVTVLHRFVGGTDGSSPSALVEASDGNFYGTTLTGGPNQGGTVFKIAPTGELTTIQAFYNAVGTAYTANGLTVGPDGNLYGAMATENINGGAGASYASSYTFFRVTPGGGFTPIRALAARDGSYPGEFTVGADGFLYGIGTRNYPDGGNNTVLARYALDGTFTVLHRFTASESMAAPRLPAIGSDGSIYCLTSFGSFERIASGLAPGEVTYVSVQATIPTVTAATGQAGAVTVSRGGSSDTSRDLLVRLTYDGTARAGSDYAPLPAAVVIPAGAASTGLTVNAVLGAAGGSLNVHVAAGDGYTANPNAGVAALQIVGSHPAFSSGEVPLTNGVYYLSFPNGNVFGYYSYLLYPHYLYHFDMGYEYWFEANDGKAGVYLYDFKSNGFFYTSPVFPFPYLYDFTLRTVVFYYPDPNNPGRYNTNGVRYFYRFDTGQIFSK